jgi:hypothetical protein
MPRLIFDIFSLRFDYFAMPPFHMPHYFAGQLLSAFDYAAAIV